MTGPSTNRLPAFPALPDPAGRCSGPPRLRGKPLRQHVIRLFQFLIRRSDFLQKTLFFLFAPVGVDASKLQLSQFHIQRFNPLFGAVSLSLPSSHEPAPPLPVMD